jgi:DNA-binding PadR family transcriptional regulator
MRWWDTLRIQKVATLAIHRPILDARLPTFPNCAASKASVYTDRYELTPMPTTKPPAPLEPHWFQILLTLADRDLHGLAIMNDVLERTGGRMRLWPGMLYRALGRLADIGLVTEIEPPDDVPRAGGRPRFFRITPAGRRACAAEAERLAGFVAVARRKKLLRA